MAPLFPRYEIKKAINDTLNAMYPQVFAVKQYQFNYIAARTTYDIPDEAQHILSVTHSVIGPSKEWLPVRHFRLDRQADPIIWNTGKTILIREGIIPGRTVHVVYTKVPSELQYDTDDFATTTGLEESAREVIILGAAYRTAMYLDLGRVPAATAEADAQQGNDPVGSAVNIGRAIQAQYQQRLAQEVRRLQEQYPQRTHYTT